MTRQASLKSEINLKSEWSSTKSRSLREECHDAKVVLKVGSGCSPLESQYLIGKVGGKESLLYSRGRQQRGNRHTCVQRLVLPANNQWSRAFIGRGRGLQAETAQSALTVILKLVIGGLINFILNVLGTVHLQFQSWFVPISLRSFLGILATYVKAVAPHSSTLAWKIPWMEEPGRLWSMGSLRVGHD